MSVWLQGTALGTARHSLAVSVYKQNGYVLVDRNSFINSPAPPQPLSLSPAVPPNITMPPVAVTPDETTTRCCAGVRVFLEHPSDPTLVFTAQVSTEGSPFTARSVTREGDVVYVQGLLAGTPYNIRLTGWNQFGRVTKEVLATPQIGEMHMVCIV